MYYAFGMDLKILLMFFCSPAAIGLEISLELKLCSIDLSLILRKYVLWSE